MTHRSQSFQWLTRKCPKSSKKALVKIDEISKDVFAVLETIDKIPNLEIYLDFMSLMTGEEAITFGVDIDGMKKLLPLIITWVLRVF